MRSITIDNEKKCIIINLHLEEVFHNLFTYRTNWSNESAVNSTGDADKETEQKTYIKHNDDQNSLLINITLIIKILYNHSNFGQYLKYLKYFSYSNH